MRVQRCTMSGPTRRGEHGHWDGPGSTGARLLQERAEGLTPSRRQEAQWAQDITVIGDPGGLVALRAILDGPLCSVNRRCPVCKTAPTTDRQRSGFVGLPGPLESGRDVQALRSGRSRVPVVAVQMKTASEEAAGVD